MGALLALAGLFAAAFGAATILPFQSEIVFVGLQVAGTVPVIWILIVASIGNTLGSVVNYVLGAVAAEGAARRWLAPDGKALARARGWYNRWGVWSLLLSWAPFGDAVTVVAGVMRTPFLLFLTLVAIAKTGRYAVLAWITAQAAG